MTSKNPYIGDSNDDDIFTDDTSDPVTAPKILGPNGEELPAEMVDALSPYVSWGEESKTLPASLLGVSHLLGWLSRFSYFKEDGSLLLAVAEILDEMTDGKVTLLHSFHEARRRLIYTHINNKVINSLLTLVQDVLSREDQTWGEAVMYLECIAETNNFVLERAKETYLTICRQLDRQPDGQLIEGGTLSERTKFEKAAFARPRADRDAE